eukprot:2307027-Rhodomonas_salina.1
MIPAACDAHGGAARSKVDGRQRISHLTRNATNTQVVALPHPAAPPSPPTLDLASVQNGASIASSDCNAHGGAAGPKVDGRQRVSHLPRVVAA